MQTGSGTVFELIESNLEELCLRMPNVPATSILLYRVILRLARLTAATFEQHVRPYGLKEVEFRVLTALYSHPDGMAHPSDLLATAAQSAANISRISDVLVNRDLITRVLSSKDRRRIVLRITQQGEELVRELWPILCVPPREMMRDLPESDQKQMIAQLRHFGRILDWPEGAPGDAG
jgi:MarR family transcriptional regulator, negative regulator of the multidrug operon emrRAB